MGAERGRRPAGSDGWAGGAGAMGGARRVRGKPMGKPEQKRYTPEYCMLAIYIISRAAY